MRSQTEFPEYVSVKTGGGQGYCGATILDSNHILTAAHCEPAAGTDKIVAGTIERSGAGGSTHILEKCTRHPQGRKGSAVWIAGKLILALPGIYRQWIADLDQV